MTAMRIPPAEVGAALDELVDELVRVMAPPGERRTRWVQLFRAHAKRRLALGLLQACADTADALVRELGAEAGK